MVTSNQIEFANTLFNEAKYYCQQKREFKQKMMGKCDIYIISNIWIQEWKKYVSYSSIKQYLQSPNSNKIKLLLPKNNKKNKPKPIDNNSLFIPFDSFVNNGNLNNQYNYIIKEDKKRNKHFKCISKEIWDLFEFKYNGGPMIKKQKTTNMSIEDCLYSIQLNVIIFPSKEYFTEQYIQTLQPLTFYASANETIKNCMQSMLLTLSSLNCKNILKQYNLNNCDKKHYILWQLNKSCDLQSLKMYYTMNAKKIKKSSISIQVMRLPNFNVEKFSELIIKSVYKKDTLLVLEYLYSNDSTDNEQMKVTNDVIHKPQLSNLQIGLSGLNNLGNTCFMNTSIQCLSNYQFLTEYCLKDYYKAHINKNNPIGSKGVLAASYAELLKNMWDGSNKAIFPTQFKSAISSFQSIFNGVSQHDTHEFLNYLLDGLHEDLNLVHKKPYINEEDLKGNDDELFRVNWINFQKRNQSIICDLFYGIYKSTIYCLNESCGNIMKVFEPYLSVNVPLAVSIMPCFFLFYDLSIVPIEIKIPLENDRCLGSLRYKLSVIFNVKPFSFVMGFITKKGELKALYSSDKPLREMERLFCFQINPFFTKETHSKFSRLFKVMSDKKKEINEILNQDGLIENMPSKERIYYTTSSNNLLVNIDNNNYLPRSFIKIILHLFIHSTRGKKKIMFPRIIYIKKEWTTISLYEEIISYYSHLIIKENRLNNKENIMSKCFPNLKTVLQEKNEILENEQKELNYPFVLQFKPINDISKCLYCGKLNCKGCLIPYNNQITVEEILTAGADHKDNTYYYISDNDKERYNLINNDFEIEVIWLEKYEDIISSLNNIQTFNLSESEKEIELSQCLKRFEYPEILDGDNKVCCSKCKTLQKVEKHLELYTAPCYLIIQLKRFNRNGKITTKVNFPLHNFDISKYVKKKAKQDSSLEYDLISIANHFGDVNGGHYVAYAKNYINNNWYEYNDSLVSLINECNLVTANAYVLFYQRKMLNTYINKEMLFKKQFIDYSKNSH